MKLFDFLTIADSRVEVFANRFSTRWLSIAVVVTPLIIAFLLPVIIWGKTIFSFIPNSSDEVTYWREIKSFVDHGFGSGQYSNDELTARFTASPFGVHGPAFAVTYGLIGKLFGWEEFTPVIVNFSLLAMAAYGSIRVAKPSNKQLLVMLVLFATWWPLQLYLTSNMQEALHSSAAILLAALFYRLVTGVKDRHRFLIYISLLLIFLVSFRYIWAFLLFPAILFLHPQTPLRFCIRAIAGMAVLLAVGAWFVLTFYSSSPWFWSSLLETLSMSKSAALGEFVDHFLQSAQSFVSLDKGLPLVVLLRYQVIGILVAVVIWIVRYASRSGKDAAPIWFTLFNVGSVFAFVLFFYDVLDTRDYRMLIAPLLLSLLLLIFTHKLNFVYPIIFVNLVAVVFFVSYYPIFRNDNFNYAAKILQETDAGINSNIEFDLNGNRWCNTISIGKYGQFNTFAYPLTQVDSGFGTTTILEWKQFLERPLQAKYVLLDPEYCEPGFGYPVNHFDLVEITATPIGTLFLNPHSACLD